MSAVKRQLTNVRWAAKISELAPGLPARAWFFAAVVLLPVKRRLLRDRPIPVRIKLGSGSTTFWFSDSSELFALGEIFADGEYAAVDGGSPATIVDLGANCGQAALWFRSRFPGATILSVEPDPDTFAKLERNLGGDPLVTLRQAAITGHDGAVSLERTDDSSWGTRVAEAANGAGSVQAVSLQTLLAEHRLENVDLLKVDIEGLEHEALGDCSALERAGLVVGEIHADLIAVPTDRALEDMRRSGGFARAELDGDIFLLSRA